MYLLHMETEKPKAVVGATIAAATSDEYLEQNNKTFVLFQTGKAIAVLTIGQHPVMHNRNADENI
jgi:hypothetical protein